MKTHTIRNLKIAEIQDAPYNPRTITDTARKGLGESLDTFGLVEMPVVNDHGGRLRLIGGHRRVEQLRARDVSHVDCIVVDFDPADEMAANLALNSSSIRGRYDAHKLPESLLRDLAKDLPTPDFAGFDALMSDLHAKSGYAESQRKLRGEEQNEASDGTVEAGKQVRSKLGRVYRLGEHRLYCGSHEDGVGKLFPKRTKAAVTLTDPPYGEAYVARNGANIENDEVEPFKQRMVAWAKSILRASDVVYLFCSSRRMAETDAIWNDRNTSVWQWLVWAKDRPTTQFPNYRGDYHHQCEFILFGGRGTMPSIKARPNVLEFPKPHQNELHPTQKPTALIRTLMEDSTELGAIVFDPFAGSGTTLVVAEELGRVCYACEVDPVHCDTIRRRWVQQVHGDTSDWTRRTPAINSRQ